jgi:hypothetical protein
MLKFPETLVLADQLPRIQDDSLLVSLSKTIVATGIQLVTECRLAGPEFEMCCDRFGSRTASQGGDPKSGSCLKEPVAGEVQLPLIANRFVA